MREFEFRVWDKVNESMHDVQGISFYHESISVDRDDGTYFANHASNFELMQYTGLKDKNGTEIYEGDIVRGPHDFGPGGFSVIAAPVKYHVIHGYQLHYFLLEQTEVIGNIYNN